MESGGGFTGGWVGGEWGEESGGGVFVAGKMTAEEFVEKWSRTQLSEKAASQEHFIDLCRLIGEATPAEADPEGRDYCFEKAVQVVGAASRGSKGEAGFVDVWKRGCFGWEYKRKEKYKNLDEAYRQLYQYRDALDNPPLSVVCDIQTTEIRTHFTGYPPARTVIRLEEIPGKLEILRRIFRDPEWFRPAKTREQTTKDLAKTFGELADMLLSRHAAVADHLFQGAGDPVAHFLMKVMFCLFAEDTGLLPDDVFTKLVNRCLFEPEHFPRFVAELFEKMKTGGWYGNDRIEFFNGGLFDSAPPIALKDPEIRKLRVAADQGWAGVEPSIFGTLFERILDPKKRAQIGAHYTSKEDILLIVDPVVMAPLRREWEALREKLKGEVENHDAESNRKKRDVLAAPIRIGVEGFRRRLAKVKVLDPACGSGNFLYVALQRLLDLEDEAVRFAALHGIAMDPVPRVRPMQMHGIEINPYAAELAQVVIWIGYLQWIKERHIDDPKRPILDKLQCIENRDAILDLRDGKNPRPAEWPEADFVIGNPPFLGSKLFRKSGLSDDYLKALFQAYDLPKTIDLCCYWFELAGAQIAHHSTTRAGLLATQGIRGGDNREVLRRIKDKGEIFLAWSDHEWVLDGAAVNVSIVGFDAGKERSRTLDGKAVEEIHANLAHDVDTGAAGPLTENDGIAFMGDTKGGAFDVEWSVAAQLLRQPNPNGRSNAAVVRPWTNGMDVTRRPRAMFIVDFGCDMPKQEAAGFEAPFRLVEERVSGERAKNRREAYAKRWWIHVEPRPAMRARLTESRFIATPNLTKYRLFVAMEGRVLPDHQLIVFARADDYFLGVLQSSLHELWALRMGTQLEDRPRYTPTTCFETFPLPWAPGKEPSPQPSPGVPGEGEEKDIRAEDVVRGAQPTLGRETEAYRRIGEAAKGLNEQRERWLNPPEWIELIERKVDEQDTFEDVPEEARALIRRSAVMAAAAKDGRLKKRTLTNLYNERPTWLKLGHEALDRAVLAAYGSVDPEGGWEEDWAEVWVESGAGQGLAEGHSMAKRRGEVDRRVLENLLRLNGERARGRRGG